MPVIDLTGQKFHRLLVLERSPNRGGTTMWLCQCDCGNQKMVAAKHLRRKSTRSCGCLNKEKSVGQIIHGLADTRVYNIWHQMLTRCYNPKYRDYYKYGGRGINVCNRWRNSLMCFYEDMGHPPDGRTLDRIRNWEGYSPSNCRWATPSEQARNTRRNRYLTLNGRTLLLCEWEELTGISASTICNRITRGWSVRDALTKPSVGNWRSPSHSSQGHS